MGENPESPLHKVIPSYGRYSLYVRPRIRQRHATVSCVPNIASCNNVISSKCHEGWYHFTRENMVYRQIHQQK